MTDYREILRLKSIGYSNREIAASVRSSHHTIKTVLELAQKHGVSCPIDNDVTNADLEKLFFPERKNAGVVRKEPDYAYIHKELCNLTSKIQKTDKQNAKNPSRKVVDHYFRGGFLKHFKSVIYEF